MSSTKRVHDIAAVLLGCLILTEPAYAYLDPGTGSMIMQIILGGVAGLAVAGKLFWSQIRAFFHNLFARGDSRQSETNPLSSDEANFDTDRNSEHNDNK